MNLGKHCSLSPVEAAAFFLFLSFRPDKNENYIQVEAAPSDRSDCRLLRGDFDKPPPLWQPSRGNGPACR
jgi:hypothetical protein